MKDNKNKVFALNSFTTNSPTPYFQHHSDVNLVFTKQGFLLFVDEDSADRYLEMCDRINLVKKQTDYSKYGYVEVSDFVADKVNTNKQFYVTKITDYHKENNDTFNAKQASDSEVVTSLDDTQEA